MVPENLWGFSTITYGFLYRHTVIMNIVTQQQVKDDDNARTLTSLHVCLKMDLIILAWKFPCRLQKPPLEYDRPTSIASRRAWCPCACAPRWVTPVWLKEICSTLARSVLTLISLILCRTQQVFVKCPLCQALTGTFETSTSISCLYPCQAEMGVEVLLPLIEYVVFGQNIVDVSHWKWLQGSTTEFHN